MTAQNHTVGGAAGWSVKLTVFFCKGQSKRSENVQKPIERSSAMLVDGIMRRLCLHISLHQGVTKIGAHDIGHIESPQHSNNQGTLTMILERLNNRQSEIRVEHYDL